MKTLPKLALRKETITLLNDDQMKKFVGGAAGGSSLSCSRRSCDSKSDAGSCNKRSCNCAAEVPGDAGQGLEG